MKFLSSLKLWTKTTRVMEVRGIEPPDSWMISLSPHRATPMTKILYHKIMINKNMFFVPFPYHEVAEGCLFFENSCDMLFQTREI